MANEFKVKKGLVVNGSGSVILDIQGSQGQLFSVTDSLTGSLFSVNDISGMPILAVSSDDSVRLGTFNREAIRVSGSNATITGSFTGSFTGNLTGTASWANNAVTASFVATSSYANNADLLDGLNSTVFATTGSNTFVGNQTITGSVNISGSISSTGTITAQTLVVQTITSSTDFVTGSTRFGTLLSNTHQFTGSVSITGSLNGTNAVFRNDAASLIMNLQRTGSSGVRLQLENIGIDAFGIGMPATTSDLAFYSSNTNERVRITSGGNVGIGTNSPLGQLHISSGTSGDAVLIIEADTDNSDENDTPQIWLKADGGTNEGLIGLKDNTLDFVSNVGTLGGFRFLTGTTNTSGSTDPYTGASVKMTINSNGNVGIGTTSPVTKLEVSNATDDRHFLAVGSAPSLNLGNTNTGPLYYGTLGLATATNNFVQGAVAGDLAIVNRGSVSGSILFGIGSLGNERMRITPTGNVGIGTATPTLATLQVNGNVHATSFTGSFLGTASFATNALTASFAMNGGGGGLSALYIQDEGTTQGTASYINFTGTGVTATVTSGTASISITGGGGSTTGQSVLFTQASPATTWTFSHNLNTQYVTYNVYDSNSNAIIPANVSASNSNTLVITFSVATAGYAVATVGGGLPFISGSFNGYILTVSGSSAAWTPTSSISVLSASYAQQATSASYALIATSASYASASTSASYASSSTSASFASTAAQAQTASFVTLAQTASFVTTAQTASFVATASYALNADLLDGVHLSTLATTGSNTFVGTQTITGSILQSGSFTSTGTITAQTLVVQTITSSTDFVTGSTRFGSLLSNTHVFTGSVGITGSLAVNGTTATLGTGTINTVPKFTAANIIGNSNITDDGSLITLNTGSYINGALGIGTTGLTGYNLRVSINPSAATAYGIMLDGLALSSVTTSYHINRTLAQTQAASFTLPELAHYYATQGTFGTGSTVTNQYGFIVGNLTGAGNNYGFYGNIASGTNRWNLYMNGTANNYMAGSLGIGSTSLSIFGLRLSKTITGGTIAYNQFNDGSVQSDVTSEAMYYSTNATTAASAFTLTNLFHYRARYNVFGAGSSVTNQYGFYVDSALTAATNNYGFFGNIASGTNRWNLFMNGTADNHLGGKLTIGSATTSNNSIIYISRPISGSTTANGIIQELNVSSDVTTQAFANRTILGTAAASFTLPILSHYVAGQGTIGAGSSVTTQVGYWAQSNMIGATNNYGFRGAIPSGTGRWNLYMDGTAANYLEGDTSIGTTTGGYKLNVNGTANITGNTIITGSLTVVTGSAIELLVTNTGVRIGSVITDVHTVTGSLSISGSTTAASFTGSLLGTASRADNATSASFSLVAVSSSFSTTAVSASFASNTVSSSYSLVAVSASFATNATSASFVNTLNQNVLITGSLTVGSGSLGASENTLTLGARDTAGEGGQLGFNAPGGTYTSASMLDNYQNRLRVLRGTNAGSDAEVAWWSMHNKQMALPAYSSSGAFPGTAVANLAVDSGGNVITVATGTVTSASYAATASIATSSSFASTANSSSYALTATSASYAATASVSSTTFGIGATIQTYGSVVSSIVGSNNLFTQNTGSYTSAFFKYTAANGANTRAGEVIAAWNGTTTSITDFSTVDIGNTSAVTASVSIVAGQAQFNIQTNTSGWAIKSIATFM